jgi:hypothetical protein
VRIEGRAGDPDLCVIVIEGERWGNIGEWRCLCRKIVVDVWAGRRRHRGFDVKHQT